MPLDSRAKRRSSTGILQPWRPSLPLPLDSPAVVDQADKQESVWTYSGILAVYTPAEQILVTGTWRVAPVLTGTWHDRDVCAATWQVRQVLAGAWQARVLVQGDWTPLPVVVGDWSVVPPEEGD